MPPAARDQAHLRSRARRFGFGVRTSRNTQGDDNLGGYQLYEFETGDVVVGARFDLDYTELEAAISDRAANEP